MSEPFLAEVKIISWNFAPRGWAFCDGQILPINQNQSLYSLLGTTYGGDGRTSFALPDLRGRTPMHVGSSIGWGQRGGEETHTLSVNEMPQHSHPLNATSADATTSTPAVSPGDPAVLLARSSTPIYHGATNLVAANAAAVSNTGGGQAHNNMQPYLVLNFVIALQGIFPSRN